MYAIYANKVFERDEPVVVMVPHDKCVLNLHQIRKILVETVGKEQGEKLHLAMEAGVLRYNAYMSEEEIFNEEEEELPF